jgi:hypothetical protein
MSVKLWESVKLCETVRGLGRISKAGSKRRFGLAAMLGAALLPMCSGCSTFTAANNAWTYNRQWNDKMLRDKHVVASRRAWNARSSCFQNQKHIKEFSRGFRAGYMDVADGGTGCVPSFPPREYWGWRYQSCEGQEKVSAWFSGFPHGVRAAEEDGIGNYYQMQTSAGIQQQYVQHGMLDPAYQGIYPIPQTALPNGAGSGGAKLGLSDVNLESSAQKIEPMIDPIADQ